MNTTPAVNYSNPLSAEQQIYQATQAAPNKNDNGEDGGADDIVWFMQQKSYVTGEGLQHDDGNDDEKEPMGSKETPDADASGVDK